jgi:hypothetical protein
MRCPRREVAVISLEKQHFKLYSKTAKFGMGPPHPALTAHLPLKGEGF